MDRPFHTLSDSDMQQLASRGATAGRATPQPYCSYVRDGAKSGQLDAKATIRANLKHGGVPFQIKHRDRSIKPKLVIICDISTSMRHCSELMLSLLYELQDQVSKTHAFSFIDHLEYITPDFQGNRANEAIQQVLTRMPPGYYSTDLGLQLCRTFTDRLYRYHRPSHNINRCGRWAQQLQ